MNKYDKLLDNIFFEDDRLNKSIKNKFNRLKNKKYIQIKKYIDNRYSDSLSERETLYRIHYNIENRPVCKICGKPVKFQGRNTVFSIYCSHRCKKLDPEVNKKWKESCGEKGTNRKKAKQTTLDRYGYENPYQIPDVINKIKRANKEKKDEAQEKSKQTCLEKYGESYFFKSVIFKDKVRNTSLSKYGTKHPMQSNIVKSKYNWKELSSKCIETKKKNGTINSSKPEDDTYTMLLEIFPDTIRQYKSNLYPYYCDFYVPSINTYIECQYGWTHGQHPFNEDNENDLQKAHSWKNKNSEYYSIALDVWTRKDVEKRQTAFRNNLNYIELWSLEEAKKWIEKAIEIIL